MNDIIKLINAYYNKRDAIFNDLDKLEADSIDHTLHPYLFLVTNDKKYKKYNVGAIYTNEAFDKLKNEISEILSNSSIDHLFFKGTIIKNYYDEAYLRKMGDIDFLVRKDDYLKAKKLLIDNGYLLDDHQSQHHISLYKNELEVELHQSMFDSEDPRYKFFLNVWDNINNKEGFEYEMDITYHYVYLICHLEYHILHGGAGIRPLIDLYLLKNKIDNDKLNNYLSELGLTEFNNHLNSLIDYIFNDNKINEIDLELLDFLYKSGIHGFKEGNDQKTIKYAGTAKKGKFRYLLRKLFPTIEAMKLLYPTLNKCILLLPICYIRRFFYVIFKRRKEAKGVIGIDNNDVVKYKDLFKKIGL